MLHIFHGFSLSFLPSSLAPPRLQSYLLAAPAEDRNQQGHCGVCWFLPLSLRGHERSPPTIALVPPEEQLGLSLALFRAESPPSPGLELLKLPFTTLSK